MIHLEQIPWALVAPLIGVQLILMLVALVDLHRNYAVNGPKWMWVILIMCISIFGSIAYFIFGRKK